MRMAIIIVCIKMCAFFVVELECSRILFKVETILCDYALPAERTCMALYNDNDDGWICDMFAVIMWSEYVYVV